MISELFAVREFHKETGPTYRDGYEALIRGGLVCFLIVPSAVNIGAMILLQDETPILLFQDTRFVINFLAGTTGTNKLGEHVLASGVGLVLSISVYIDTMLMSSALVTMTLYLRLLFLSISRLHIR